MKNFTYLVARRWVGHLFLFISVLTLMSSCIGVTLTNENGDSFTNGPSGSGPAQLSACVGSSVTLAAGCSMFVDGPIPTADGTPYFVGPGGTFTAQGDGTYVSILPVTTTGPQTYTLDCTFPASFTETTVNLPYSFTVLGADCPDRCTTGSASNLQVNGIVGAGNCSVRITGAGNGKAFVFRGPGGYVYSNTFRSCGPHSIFANGIRTPGTYTLNVYGDSKIPLATYSIEVTGSACP